MPINTRRRTSAPNPPARVNSYRYPSAPGPLGVTQRLAGPEQVFRFTLRKRVAALPPGHDEERRAARHRLGAILKDRLGDPRGAEEQLVEGLAAGGGGEGHVPSMLTLAAIYRDRGDWLKARQLLSRAAAVARDRPVRVGAAEARYRASARA